MRGMQILAERMRMTSERYDRADRAMVSWIKRCIRVEKK